MSADRATPMEPDADVREGFRELLDQMERQERDVAALWETFLGHLPPEYVEAAELLRDAHLLSLTRSRVLVEGMEHGAARLGRLGEKLDREGG